MLSSICVTIIEQTLTFVSLLTTKTTNNSELLPKDNYWQAVGMS